MPITQLNLTLGNQKSLKYMKKQGNNDYLQVVCTNGPLDLTFSATHTLNTNDIYRMEIRVNDGSGRWVSKGSTNNAAAGLQLKGINNGFGIQVIIEYSTRPTESFELTFHAECSDGSSARDTMNHN